MTIENFGPRMTRGNGMPLSAPIGVVRRTTTEIVRHILFRLNAGALVEGIRNLRGTKTAYLKEGDRLARFERIYKDQVWETRGKLTADEMEPGSGAGSSLLATVAIRAALPAALRRLGTDVLLDVGCGDQTWISKLDLPARYIGVDIVPDLIEANRIKFGSSGREFHCLDACADELPAADTVISREVLFHLSYEDAGALLRNVLRKPRRWVILTSDSGTLFNANIRSGDFRFLNLMRRPFSFPEPSMWMDDSDLVKGRRMGIWAAEAIRAAAKAMPVEQRKQVGSR